MKCPSHVPNCRYLDILYKNNDHKQHLPITTELTKIIKCQTKQCKVSSRWQYIVQCTADVNAWVCMGLYGHLVRHKLEKHGIYFRAFGTLAFPSAKSRLRICAGKWQVKRTFWRSLVCNVFNVLIIGAKKNPLVTTNWWFMSQYLY